MATVMDLLDDPALDALITGESPFADLPRVMAELSRHPRGVFCHRVVYADDGLPQVPTGQATLS
jgi:hypothetical protein